jgi:hypothetical protein
LYFPTTSLSVALMLGTHRPTPEQQRLMANGQALDAIYPALPAAVKAKLSPSLWAAPQKA